MSRRCPGAGRLAGAVVLFALLWAGPAPADEERVQFLVDRLQQGDTWKVRMAAALALGTLGHEDGLGPLYGALCADESAPVRLAAIGALGQQEFYEAFVALAEAGLTVHGVAGKTAARIMDLLWDKRTVFDRDAWREALADRGSAWRRARAAWILGLTGDKKSATKLVRLLKDRDAGVRRAAALALGRLGVKKSKKALARAARDKDPQVKRAAKAALRLVARGGYKPRSKENIEYPAMIDGPAYREAMARIMARPAEEEEEPPPPTAPQPAAERRGYPTVAWERFESLLQGTMSEVLDGCLGALPKGQKVDGVVKVRFGFDDEGALTDPEIVDDDLGVEPVSRCLLAGLGEQQFAALPEGVNVITYGFTITAGQDQQMVFEAE